ncbi:kinase-like domain-containing protein [Suillus paluster]|uniref:kinase-like domain-containing protein n=1 Tax=Suillus paluster TaxID=48578 RepID=UPI001B880D0F|nr:kinase-like domain-containing protein [Suillus paluster]KAG1726248.1 kinase-like domain-containing protein [Suillus paluster]
MTVATGRALHHGGVSQQPWPQSAYSTPFPRTNPGVSAPSTADRQNAHPVSPDEQPSIPGTPQGAFSNGVEMAGTNTAIQSRPKLLPTQEQLSHAVSVIQNMKRVFSAKLPTMQLHPLSDDQRMEYYRLLQQLHEMTRDLDAKLPMYLIVLHSDIMICNLVAIVSLVVHQRASYPTESCWVIIDPSALQSMYGLLQQMLETVVVPQQTDDGFAELLLNQPSPSSTAPSDIPFTQSIPQIPIPDLTRHITRCSQDPVDGGAYGNIYQCLYYGYIMVAVKVFRRELGIWKRLQHSNILKFMGITRGFGSSVALVAPWIDNGTLTSFLKRNNGILTLHDRLLLVRTSRTFPLCDIELTISWPSYMVQPLASTINNVLVGSNNTAYLADFGLSGTLTKSPGMTYLAKMSCRPGALRWAAPELLSVDESAASAPTTRSDIYSFGCIMLQVLTGDVPWHHLKIDFAIWSKVTVGEIYPRPGCVTDRHWNFMTRCWSMTPTDRPSATEVLQFVDSKLALRHDTQDTISTAMIQDAANCQWNEWIRSPIRYYNLTLNSQITFTVCDIGGPRTAVPVGSSTFRMLEGNSLLGIFAMHCKGHYIRTLRRGKHRWLLWSGQEADGSMRTKTPNCLEKLVKKYERSDLSKSDWLDNMAFRKMEEIHASTEGRDRKVKEHASLYRTSMFRLSRDIQRAHPHLWAILLEDKHRRLVLSHRSSPYDRELKPNAKIRDELWEILNYAPSQYLNSEEKDLIRKFRFSLALDTRGLTKSLKYVTWRDPSEVKQAVEELLPMWTEADTDDALEFLEPRTVDSRELLLYLLKLESASIEVELEDKVVAKMYGRVVFKFLNKILEVTRLPLVLPSLTNPVPQLKNGSERCELMRQQGVLVETLTKRAEELRTSKDPRPKKKKNSTPSSTPRTGSSPFLPYLCHSMHAWRSRTSTLRSLLAQSILKMGMTCARKGDLDLKLISHDVLATGPLQVMVQLIPSKTKTIAAIISENGMLLNYLRANNPDEGGVGTCAVVVGRSAVLAVMCAKPSLVVGHFVVTYLLGVGDRHLDNLLLAPGGHFFHVDIGYILGRDPKPFPPPIKVSLMVDANIDKDDDDVEEEEDELALPPKLKWTCEAQHRVIDNSVACDPNLEHAANGKGKQRLVLDEELARAGTRERGVGQDGHWECTPRIPAKFMGVGYVRGAEDDGMSQCRRIPRRRG